MSPPQPYNFTSIPKVSKVDAFWEMKKSGKKQAPVYADIFVPKNTAMGVYVGLAALVFGGAIIWHIMWLAALGLLAVIVLLAIHLTRDETEEIITVAELKKLEGGAA